MLPQRVGSRAEVVCESSNSFLCIFHVRLLETIFCLGNKSRLEVNGSPVPLGSAPAAPVVQEIAVVRPFRLKGGGWRLTSFLGCIFALKGFHSLVNMGEKEC